MKIQQLYPAACGGLGPDVSPDRIISEEKIDGHRALLHAGADLDRTYLSGRRLSAKTGLITEKGLNVPHLNEVNRIFKGRGLGLTILDGEVVLPGRPFEDVQSVMGAGHETAVLRQDDTGLIHYRVFDILFYNGKDLRDLPLHERRDWYSMLCSELSLVHVTPVVWSPRLDEYFGLITDAGGEGTVEKDLDALYGKGWRKRKKEFTFDVVVTGFTEGAGKYQEMIGAVQFSCYRDGKLVEVGQCSGMSDGNVYWCDADGKVVKANSPGSRIRRERLPVQPEGTRAWFSQHREKLIGSVIEVRCNGITKHERLRHPQFYRVRPDKDKAQCAMPKEQVKTCKES